jgi:hypothetical protein
MLLRVTSVLGLSLEASTQQRAARVGRLIRPACRVCRREARAFQRHFEGPLPRALPRRAHLPGDLARLVQGGHCPDVQIVSQRRLGLRQRMQSGLR